jgi:hypothetical protein
VTVGRVVSAVPNVTATEFEHVAGVGIPGAQIWKVYVPGPEMGSVWTPSFGEDDVTNTPLRKILTLDHGALDHVSLAEPLCGWTLSVTLD